MKKVIQDELDSLDGDNYNLLVDLTMSLRNLTNLKDLANEIENTAAHSG